MSIAALAVCDFRPLPGFWLFTRAACAFVLLAGTSEAQLPVPVAFAITVTSIKLPPATVGAAYSQMLTATGGTAPYTWKLDGLLPKGLTLNAAGLLSGMPKSPYLLPVTFSVTAQDSKGNTSPITPILVNVNAEGLTITTVSSLSSPESPSIDYPPP